MTVSIKVHVNGKYRATVRKAVEVNSKLNVETYVINPQEEKHIYFSHGHVNHLEITEEYLGEDWCPTPTEGETK